MGLVSYVFYSFGMLGVFFHNRKVTYREKNIPKTWIKRSFDKSKFPMLFSMQNWLEKTVGKLDLSKNPADQSCSNISFPLKLRQYKNGWTEPNNRLILKLPRFHLPVRLGRKCDNLKMHQLKTTFFPRVLHVEKYQNFNNYINMAWKSMTRNEMPVSFSNSSSNIMLFL